MERYNFDQLFIFDLANNHQGDVNHGSRIIQGLSEVALKQDIRAAIKFQFRDLDTFIHPDYLDSKSNKHIQRFLSTRLTDVEFSRLHEEIRAYGMLTAATPFDEASVDKIVSLDIDIIKIASCSATDKPLLEKVVTVSKPIIISTGGLSLNQIDRLVNFLQHKNMDFALMHCVSLYPTLPEQLRLNQIELLRKRFPDVSIGFSTHEEPENLNAIQMAYGKGARIFERHVGLTSDKYSLNAYSSTPQQISQWIEAYKNAVRSCGGENRSPTSPEESNSLKSLARGVFAKKDIEKGKNISKDDIFFAMPLLEGQLASSDWHEWLVAEKKYCANEPLSLSLSSLNIPVGEIIYQVMLQVKGLLNQARIFIGKDSSIEISHHYGMERFREFGCVLINCINRAYAKKLVIQLPRQKHPYHYHKKKEETFQLLYGDLEVEIEGKKTKLQVGDMILVPASHWHKFHTLDGAIFEEVSTTHHNDDSFYEDERIALLPRESRKTTVENWEKSIEENSSSTLRSKYSSKINDPSDRMVKAPNLGK